MLSCHAHYKNKEQKKKNKKNNLLNVSRPFTVILVQVYTITLRFSRCELVQRIVNWIWSAYRLLDRIIILNINLHLNAYSLHV